LRQRNLVLIAAALALVAGGAYAYRSVAASLKAGTVGAGAALGAQIGCADVYLMHRDIAEAERNDLHSLASAAAVIHLTQDKAHRSVTATIPFILARTAYYRDGLGCTLATDDASPPTTQGAPPRPSPPGDGQGLLSEPSAIDPAIQATLARIFRQTNVGGYPDTRAMIVVKDGRIVAEAYAPGFSASTPFLGWSMTKSVTSALVGVLVGQGKLNLDGPAPVPEWRAKGDPRGAITLKNLLQMSSGLKFVEEYVAGSDSTQMLFHEANMAAYAAGKPLEHAPGSAWSYSSGTANIISRIVMDAAGGTTQAYLKLAHAALFAPLGISSMIIEPDESGTPVGSSYGYATARDWARFGELYLERGAADGRRVLPASWIDFTTEPATAAPTALYGAMFWLNQGPTKGPRARSYPSCPEDMYLADGYNGQFTAVVPSKHLVIVRLGWTPDSRKFPADRAFSAIIAAADPGASPPGML